jgi:hypothetical protein
MAEMGVQQLLAPTERRTKRAKAHRWRPVHSACQQWVGLLIFMSCLKVVRRVNTAATFNRHLHYLVYFNCV